MLSCRVTPSVPDRSPWTRLLIALVVLPLWVADAGNAADPFYDRLLQDGINAYERNDYEDAAQSLRLACFGLLEEPVVLARGLIYLALAQAELESEPEFNHTFSRLLEVERRFQGFSQLELDGDLRQLFDAHLYRWVSLDQIESSPAFREVARRKQESIILELGPAERRPELERLVAAEPDSSLWRLLLADIQLASGEYEAVMAAAEKLLAKAPQLGQAQCLRGRAAAAMSSCEQALIDLDSCTDSVDSTSLAETRLRCLIQLRDWQAASVVLAEVPAAQQRKQPFRQFARDIKKGRRAQPPPEAAPTEEPGDTASSVAELSEPEGNIDIASDSEPDVGVDTEPSPAEAVSPPPEELPESPLPNEPLPNDPSTWPPELVAELDRTRQLVPSASREELAEAFAVARELANRYRQLTEPQHLAAEIAYRLSRWGDAVTFFERGGEPEQSQPGRLFYFSVALYETGDRAGARRVLEQCLPALEMTAFVRSYVDEILASAPGE